MAELTLWQRIKNGAWATITAIPRMALWTAGFFGLSYGLGKFVHEKADFIGVADAVNGKDPSEAVGALARLAVLPAAISTGISFIGGAVATPAACPDPPACPPQANLPCTTDEARQTPGGR
jgi:hypothetical protein